jgi:hypothetical protein
VIICDGASVGEVAADAGAVIACAVLKYVATGRSGEAQPI